MLTRRGKGEENPGKLKWNVLVALALAIHRKTVVSVRRRYGGGWGVQGEGLYRNIRGAFAASLKIELIVNLTTGEPEALHIYRRATVQSYIERRTVGSFILSWDLSLSHPYGDPLELFIES